MPAPWPRPSRSTFNPLGQDSPPAPRVGLIGRAGHGSVALLGETPFQHSEQAPGTGAGAALPSVSLGVRVLEIYGKQVFTELEEIVDPRHTALLLIDVQRDFCAADGMYGAMGRDLSLIAPAVRNLGVALDAARRTGVLPIYVQNMWLPKHKAVSGAWLRFMVVKRNMDPARGCTVAGTPGAEILPEVAPRPDDIVVQKWRSSAFVGTNLDMVLRANDIKTVVCAGFVTEGCLESSARDAVFYDYYTVVLEDCIGTFDRDLHEASLKVLRTRVDVVPSASVLDIWSAAAGRGGDRMAAAAAE